jgi:C1A family cysteine protease
MKNGSIPEEDYPYLGYDSACRYESLKEDVVGHLATFTVIGVSEQYLEDSVALSPAMITIYAPPIMHYSEGIYDDTEKCPASDELLNHVLIVIGYGEEDGRKYWLAKNSWGTQWGMKGYVKFAKDTIPGGVCGLALDASHITS